MVGHGQGILGNFLHRERPVGADRLAVPAAVQGRVTERVPAQVLAHRVEARPVAEPAVQQKDPLGAGTHHVVRKDQSCHNIPCATGDRVRSPAIKSCDLHQAVQRDTPPARVVRRARRGVAGVT
ncbi:hypothetical protein GCM10017750_57560 [Streptomyces racemochromogenes]